MVDVNEPIRADEAKTLHDEFYRRHSFRIGSHRLISDLLQGRLRNEFNSQPKSFHVILPDNLLLRSSVSKNVGTTLTFVPGQAPAATEVFSECVGDSIELWRRIRALCSTLAFLAIQTPEWLRI